MDRLDFVAALTKAKPALATQDFIPILTHFCFDGKRVISYNDVLAIAIDLDSTPFVGAVPGELLFKLLSKSRAKTLEFEKDDETLLVKAARSRLKVPILEDSKFLVTYDELSKGFKSDVKIPLSEELTTAIRNCLISVGSDPTHPETLGLTLDLDAKGDSYLFATDNGSIASYNLGRLKIEDSGSYLIPTAFCDQLLKLGKTYGVDGVDLRIAKKCVKVDFGGKAFLFSKLMSNVKPLPFRQVLKKHDVEASTVALAKGFESCLDRAVTVLSTTHDQVSEITLDDKTFRILSVSGESQLKDSVVFKKSITTEKFSFRVEPRLIHRICGVISKIAFTADSVVATDGGKLVYLVLYCFN